MFVAKEMLTRSCPLTAGRMGRLCSLSGTAAGGRCVGGSEANCSATLQPPSLASEQGEPVQRLQIKIQSNKRILARVRGHSSALQTREEQD